MVTVHGSGFSAVSESLAYLQCRFNGSVVRAQLVSESSIVCNSTEADAGHVAVEVSGNGRDFSSSGVRYEFVSVLVSEVVPWTGPELGGTVVTLSGVGFVDVGLRCRFGSMELVGATVSSTSEVRCVSPVSVQTGWLGVELVSDGESLSSGGSFFVHSRVWVSSLTPLLGPVEGGTRLTVLGSHFRETSTLRCRFEESSATVVARFVDSSEVECATPAASGSGSRVVEVSMNGQQFSASGVAFTYQPSLSVSSVWPERGVAEGGSMVTVHGSGFSAVSEGLGYLQCRFNGSVVRASLVSSTAVVCNSTEAAAGHVALEVSGNGLDFSSSGVQYEFVTVLVSEVLPWTCLLYTSPSPRDS